jgi:cation:H+ antiporter
VEYLIALFATSRKTSRPELVVDVTAVRRGARDMAIGDIVGSSLVDATLSVGIGPALFPAAIPTLPMRGHGSQSSLSS